MGILTPNKFGATTPARETEFVRANDSGSLEQNTWRLYGLLTLVGLTETVIVFRQTLSAMISTWYSSRTFSHCFLVFPLAGFMVWQHRKQIATLRPRPKIWGLLLISALGVLWVLGNLGEVKLIEEGAFVGILAAILWTLLGTEVIRALGLPLAFLVFAVPFGLGLIGPLQDMTAWFAVHALNLSGVPAVLENRVLSVPTATWTVAEACSGIRYLFSSIMLGVIFAWSVYSSLKRRLLFVGASIVVPVLANGLRAYGIVMLAYLTNNRLAASVDHVVYGWVFFTLVQLMLFGVGSRWIQPRHPEAESAVVHGTQIPAAGHNLTVSVPIMTLIVAVLLIGLTPLSAHRLWNRVAADPGRFESLDPPITVSRPWGPVPIYDTTWAPDLHEANKDSVQTYTSGSNRVDLYWALYSGERGFQLLNSYNRVSNPKRWIPVGDSFEDEVIAGETTRVHRSLLQSGTAVRLVLTWYYICDENTGSAARVKYLQTKARLFGTSPSTVVLAIGIDSDGGVSAAEAVARDFLLHASFPPVWKR